MKLKLVIVKEEYIKFLSEFSPNIRENKGEKRPYIGVLFEKNNQYYIAPLSSPKPKYQRMKANLSLVKIKNGKYGVINLNNMIPVLNRDLKSFEPKGEGYKKIVNNQLRWINKDENKKLIVENSKMLHHRYIKKVLPKGMAKICNNFKLLEKKCLEWQNLQEKQIIYNPLKGIEFSITNQNILKKQHFSDPRWIAKGEVEKNNIKIKIKEQPTVINIFFQKEKKLIEKKIEVYNLSQLEISNEIELNFKLPKVKQEKLISKKIDNEIER